MKQKFLFSLVFSALILPFNMLKAQVFLDENFDSYSDGDDVVIVSEEWVTSFDLPDGFPGPDPAGPLVSSTRFVSPSNSLNCINDTYGRILHTTISEGVMYYSMNLFIEEGKAFPFQVGDTSSTEGTVALFHFKPDGNFILTNTVTEEVLLTSTYTQGEWFEFEIRANLDIANWKCYVNGVQIGTDFSYPEMDKIVMWDFQGISPDIDPDILLGGWVDDLYIESLEAEYDGFDLSIETIAANIGVVGQEREVRARVRNMGATEITSFDIVMNFNDGEVISTNEFTGLSMGSGDAMIIDFDNLITLDNGKSFTCTISNINGLDTDDVAENNESTQDLPFLYTPAENKIVYIEEATGTWCGFCPRAKVQIEWIETYFGDYVEAAAIHNSDPMETENYSPEAIGVTGYPTFFIDRANEGAPMYDHFGADAGYYDDDLFPFPLNATPFLNRLATPVDAIINPEFIYDETTGTVEVTANFEFITSGENYNVACAIVEDGLSGEDDTWSQANYYSGNNHVFTPDGLDYYDLANPIPASDMEYNHVGRFITPGESGGDVISSATAGDIITRNFTMTLDEEWNVDEIKIIVILFNSGDSQINNVKAVPLVEDTDASGINKVSNNTQPLTKVYPNPTNGNTNIQVQLSPNAETSIEVVGIDGKSIKKMSFPKGESAVTNEIDLSQCSSGIYFVSVIQGEKFETLKIIKE